MSRKTKVPAIPTIPRQIDAQLRGVLNALKEALEIQVGHRGEDVDRAITFRDLVDGGMIELPSGIDFDRGVITPIPPPGNFSTPPTPYNLTANGTFTNVILSWEGGFTHPLVAATEVYRNTSDDLNSATHIGSTASFIYVDTVEPGTTHYYWVRFRSPANVPSPYNATSGTSATTNKKVSDLLTDLNDAIGETHLSTTLSSEIAKIAPLSGLNETAASIETLLGQANSGASAVTILRDAINEQLSSITVNWSGLDGTSGLQDEIDVLVSQAAALKAVMLAHVDTNTTTWAGDGTSVGLSAEITTAIGDATNLKTGVIANVNNKTVEWQGSDGLGGIKAGISTELVNATDFKTGVTTHYTGEQVTWEGNDGNGGIKADIATELSSATSLKTGVNTETASKTISWQGNDGNGGVKADLTQSVVDATSLKSGIVSFKDSKEVSWQGNDGNGGVKADLTTNLATATNLKDGIDTYKEAKRITWESSDGTGGVKASLATNLTSATSLKDGISAEANNKSLSWQGSDGNGGIKSEISSSLTAASNLKTGVNAEVSTKTETWEGSDGNGGIKSDVTSAIGSATNLKTGISAEVTTKTNTWEGTDGNGGVKADITTNIGTATSLKDGITTSVNSQTATWQGSDGTSGVQAEISSALSTATDFKNGIQTTYNEKYLAWNGNGGSVDGINNEIVAVETFFADLSSTLMSDVTSFQATWGSGETVTSVLTEQGLKINGVVAEQYVKLDSGGKIAGYGLYNDSVFSEFAVLADVFKISDGSSEVQPFSVITGAGLAIGPDGTQYGNKTLAWQQANYPTGTWFAPGTYIDSAMIADASIDVAKIGNLTVDMAQVTGTLTAAQVGANTITSEMISATRISANKITMDGNIQFANDQSGVQFGKNSLGDTQPGAFFGRSGGVAGFNISSATSGIYADSTGQVALNNVRLYSGVAGDPFEYQNPGTYTANISGLTQAISVIIIGGGGAACNNATSGTSTGRAYMRAGTSGTASYIKWYSGQNGTGTLLGTYTGTGGAGVAAGSVGSNTSYASGTTGQASSKAPGGSGGTYGYNYSGALPGNGTFGSGGGGAADGNTNSGTPNAPVNQTAGAGGTISQLLVKPSGAQSIKIHVGTGGTGGAAFPAAIIYGGGNGGDGFVSYADPNSGGIEINLVEILNRLSALEG
ncbi:hypothetical protein OAD64_00145 [Oceanospirillaceae bacterium]|nr:hypothetical protein [Oceanospirillaceae bacterium]